MLDFLAHQLLTLQCSDLLYPSRFLFFVYLFGFYTIEINTADVLKASSGVLWIQGFGASLKSRKSFRVQVVSHHSFLNCSTKEVTSIKHAEQRYHFRESP